ncbi:proliferation-associated protein 2G4 [Toxorhynchites rutilus septentrionalis]|uniref:proliferation-associated protein 2G4 n=1 Tax=Toxorhynchites rutilus septentrionalis TaxID=329112 RepID=UPI00247A813D|nr:proliferation-associated protein 2G4 [Toxorhynchites rutilus septentrionalis]
MVNNDKQLVKEDENTIADNTVVQKYKTAGAIVNKILQSIIQSCKVGASAKAICQKGDTMMLSETAKKYKNEPTMSKGIAFPTCISVNNCICHFSPSKNDPDYTLKAGDVVKIDLGAHIDGFIAVAAHTIVVGAKPDNKCKGRAADVVLAAYHASQAALRLMKDGTSNYAVTEAVQKIAAEFKCKPIEGMLSHQLKQFKIDGEKTIIQNPTIAQKKEHEKCQFEKYEVYAMDVLISTGEGLGKEIDTKVSIYKKTEENYLLKLKASRAFYAEVKKKYGTMPFNLRNFEEEAKAKMGVHECVTHKLVEPFQVLYEKHNEIVAQFKNTVLILPNGLHVVTGYPFDLSCIESEHSIQDEEMKKLLETELDLIDAKKSVLASIVKAAKTDSANAAKPTPKAAAPATSAPAEGAAPVASKDKKKKKKKKAAGAGADAAEKADAPAVESAKPSKETPPAKA